jgi:hypothetical protein
MVKVDAPRGFSLQVGQLVKAALPAASQSTPACSKKR